MKTSDSKFSSQFNHTGNKQILYILYLLTLGVIFPAFKVLTGLPAFWPGFILLIGYTLIKYPKVFFEGGIKIIYLILFIILIYSVIPYYEFHSNIKQELFFRLFPYFVPVILIELLIRINDHTLLLKLGKLVLTCIFISSILQISAEMVLPNITRNPFIRTTGNTQFAVAYTFGYLYSLPYIIGVLVSSIKYPRVKHVVLIGLLIYSTIISGFFIALIFTFLMIFLSLIEKLQFKTKYYFVVVMIIFLILFTFRNETLSIMKGLPNSNIQDKIYGLEEKLKTGEGNSSVESRQSVYEHSLNSFIQTPFFGGGTSISSGGHSYILDKLAQYGMLGILPYLLILMSLYKSSNRLLSDKGKIIFKIIFILVILMLIFNPIEDMVFNLIIFVYIPCLINYLVSLNGIDRISPYRNK